MKKGFRFWAGLSLTLTLLLCFGSLVNSDRIKLGKEKDSKSILHGKNVKQLTKTEKTIGISFGKSLEYNAPEIVRGTGRVMPEGMVHTVKLAETAEPDIKEFGDRNGMKVRSVLWSEDFEGSFPGASWTVYDDNASSGQDYWGKSGYRFHNGSYSGWCAQEGTQAGSTQVFSDGFESGLGSWTVGDANASDGLDYWGQSSYRSSAGIYSAWCAQVGDQTTTTQIWSDGFESGLFSSSYGDENSTNGSDYWGDITYRKSAGSYSAWCADYGNQAGSTDTLFEDDFESGDLSNWTSVGDANASSGLDYWGASTARKSGGTYSSWCAQTVDPVWTTIYTEDFDHGGADPPGWTLIDGGTPGACGWQMELDGGSDYRAEDNSDAYGSGNNQDDEMISPSWDFSGYSTVYLRFWHDYNYYSGDYGDVDISTDGGNTWPYNVAHYNSDVSGVEEINISSYVAGENNVKIRWHYVASWAYWWRVDDVEVGTYTPGTPGSTYDNYMEAYMTKNLGDLSTYNTVTIYFDYWLSSETSYDYLRVQYSSDGSFWSTISGAQWSGSSGGWVFNQQVDVPSLFSTQYIRFLFYSDNIECNYEGAYVDNVVIVGSSSAQNNNVVHKYDDNMDAYLRRSWSTSTYDSARFEYDLWLQCENTNDYLEVQHSANSSGPWTTAATHTPGSGSWNSQNASIPSTGDWQTDYVRFLFHSNGSNHNYEGAYIDEVILYGLKDDNNATIHKYDNNMNAYMRRSSPFDLSSYSGAKIFFRYRLNSENPSDYLLVEYTTDGVSWPDLDSYSGGAGTWIPVSLSLPTNAINIRFRFISDGSEHNYEGAYIDAASLYGYQTNAAAHLYDSYMQSYMERTVDLTSYESAKVIFWHYMPTLDGTWDYGRLYIDGTQLGSNYYQNGGWEVDTVDLSSYCGSSRTLKWYFYSDWMDIYEGWYIDDIEVTGLMVTQLADNVPENSSTSPGYYKYNQNTWNWAGAGVRSSSNYDISLYENVSFTSPIATSNLSSGVDFVVRDYNHASTGYDYVEVYNGSGNYTVEWDNGSGNLSTYTSNPYTYVNGPYTIASGSVLKVYDVSLSNGYTYGFRIERLSGDADVGIALFKSSSNPYAMGRSAAVAISDNDYNGLGYEEWFNYPCTSWDDYGFVIWSNSSAASLDFNIVISTKPNLIANYAPGGWDAPIVPSNIQGTNTLSATLPGGGTTYIDFMKGYNNSALDITTAHKTTVLLDSFPFVNWTNSGTWPLYYNSKIDTPTTVRGGRHTFTLIVDSSDAVDEGIENDNEFAQQWVWSPIALTSGNEASYANAPSYRGPYSYPYEPYNCDGFSFTTSSSWDAVGMRNGNTVDYELLLYADYTNSTTGFETILALSEEDIYSPPINLVEFVFVDGNHQSGVELYPGVTGYGDPGTYWIEADYSSNTLIIGINGPYTMTTTDIIGCWDLPMTSGHSYACSVLVSSGNCDMGIGLLSNPNASNPYQGSRYDLAGCYADNNGAGGDEGFSIYIPTTDDYGIIVWNNGGSVNSNYTIKIVDLGANSANVVGNTQPVGWEYPIVPSNVAGGTTVSATLNGGGTTYIDDATGNPTDIWIPIVFYEDSYIDNVYSYDYMVYNPPSHWYLAYDSPTITVMGGRHTIRHLTDATYLIAESNEADNEWGKQWVWSPIVLTDDVAATYSTAPFYDDPNVPPALEPFYNCDGFSYSIASGWSVVGINPPGGVDYHLRLYTDYSGSSSGFSVYTESSNEGAGEVDFIATDGHHITPGTIYYPGVFRYSGTGSYNINYCENDLVLIEGWNPSDDTFSMKSNDVVHIHDVSPALTNNTLYYFTLVCSTGNADMGFALYSSQDADYIKSRAEYEVMADDSGSGKNELFTWTTPNTDDDFAIVVWNNTSGAKAASGYRILISTELTGIEMSWFDAIAGYEEVLLQWETLLEFDNKEWRIARAIEKDGEYKIINKLPAEGKPHTYSYTDSLVIGGTTYFYKVGDVDVGGSVEWHGPVVATPKLCEIIPLDISQNYPNPFAISTTIKYNVPGKAHKHSCYVNLQIFDVTGRLIKTLIHEEKISGRYEIEWNRKDERGRKVGTGIYLCRLSTADNVKTRMMVVVNEENRSTGR